MGLLFAVAAALCFLIAAAKDFAWLGLGPDHAAGWLALGAFLFTLGAIVPDAVATFRQRTP